MSRAVSIYGREDRMNKRFSIVSRFSSRYMLLLYEERVDIILNWSCGTYLDQNPFFRTLPRQRWELGG